MRKGFALPLIIIGILLILVVGAGVYYYYIHTKSPKSSNNPANLTSTPSTNKIDTITQDNTDNKASKLYGPLDTTEKYPKNILYLTNGDIWTSDLEGNNKKQITKLGNIVDYYLIPQTTKLSFVQKYDVFIEPTSTNLKAGILDFVSGQITPLLSESYHPKGNEISFPGYGETLSPIGDKLIYFASYSGKNTLFDFKTNTKKPFNRGGSFSKDGQYLIYTDQQTSTTYYIYNFANNIETKVADNVAEGKSLDKTLIFSPNGKFIMYKDLSDGYIYIYNIQDASRQKLINADNVTINKEWVTLNKWPSYSVDIKPIQWSYDGNKVYFYTYLSGADSNKKITEAGIFTDIYSIDLNTKKISNLTYSSQIDRNTLTIDNEFCYSTKNGKFITYKNKIFPGDSNIKQLDTETGTLKTINFQCIDNFRQVGNELYYSDIGGGGLSKINYDGTNNHLLIELTQSIYNLPAIWSLVY